MKKLRQLSIGKRVLFMFGTLCAILMAIGAFLFFSLRSIERSSRENLSYVVEEAELAEAAAQNIGLMQAVVFRHILATNPEEMGLHDQMIREIDMANAEKIAAYQKFVDTEEETRLYAIVLQARKKYLELTEQVLALSRANRNADATEFATSKQVPAYEEYEHSIKDMTNYVEKEVRDMAATMDHRIARIRVVGDVFIIVVILIAMGTGIAVAGVARRLKEDNRSLQVEVTERKAADKALQKAEEKYRSIFERSNDGIFQNTPEGRFLSANPALARILGFDSPEELISGRDDIERQGYADPAMRDKFKKTLEENGFITGFEYEVYRKDGARIWVSENSRVVRDAEGRVLYYEGSVQDITARKRAEAERQVISEIVQGVITTRNLDELLDLAHRSIGKLLYAENCFVGLHDARTNLIHFDLWVDKFDSAPPPQPISNGFTRSSYVLRTGQPLLLTKELKKQLFDEGQLAQSGSDSASWLGVPLRTPTRTIGVLAVQHYEKEGAYSQRDLEFLCSVGDQIALAIERRRADEEVKRSGERLAAAQKMAHVGSWEWDVITNEMVWSDEEYRLFGLEPGECAASYDLYLSLLHPAAREDAIKWFKAVRAMKKSSRMDTLIVRHDGTERILNSWADVVLDENDNVVRVVGTSQDVTEREKAERALGESEERFQLVSRATTDAIWDWDVRANVISYSESFGTLFGYRAGEFESSMEFWINGIHPDDHDKLMTGVYAFFASREEAWSGEYRFRCADGSYAFVYDRGHVVRDAEGKALRMVGSMMNVTSQKQVQEDLRIAKEGAEAASRTKSEFLANMSHEIRTPMNGIIGMTDLALETKLNREQREYLGMVKSSAHSLLGLINDILDFSKIEAGKLELESIDFSLRECIGGMLKPLGIRADQKGLELVADIPSDVPDHLVGDPMRLRQILINLTANAIKFTERGEVIVKVINQAATNGESHLHFSVADTGIGIPAEKQDAIFEAFAQADGSTTRTYGGTGLGLSIASHLIQKMRGKIWIESKVGQGTTFHFTARLGVRATPTPIVKHADPRDLAGLRALVVDDNAVNRRILREMLVNWRMSPTLVESGQAGLDEMLRAAKSDSAYQLVLLDALMPEMDGFALAEKIKDQPELAGATVMMLSSAMPAGSAARCGGLGVAGLLTKPVTQSELLDAILVAISPDMEGGTSREPDAGFPGTEPTGAGLRILIAEDNLVNRAVATGILEKEGYVLVHAATGTEAVEAFSYGSFDLILMDVQMPEMDGFQATRRIRELEEATGCHTRIVAMTAHAMAGDRERCLAAGMDDYVSKPLRKQDLLRALAGAGVKDDEEETGRALLYSRAELLLQCDGDEELMSELVSIFHDSTPQIVQAIGEAVEKRAAPALAAHAHKLLSSLGAFGAGRARTLALRLEKHGLESDFGGAKERFRELERETDKIYTALADFVSVLA
jgi:two-component system sensor histidine kinase/response regulator